ncbi:MAG: signal peptidase I [Flavobacteriales bacterium]
MKKGMKIVLFLVFTIVWSILVYLLNGEWLYFIPIVVADVLFFETISWQFWKKKEKKEKKKKSELRTWVEAIAFAVVAAHILRTFFIEAYTIPTSSMEKSMLIGDFLFVSKLAYGPRVPMTPVAVPLVHHTIPGTKKKSYSEIVKVPYHRMKGLGDIKRNDCVVFNWPAEKLNRPVDKKENYVKRCVGIAGDKIEIVNGQLMVNDEPQAEPEGMKKQFTYNVKTKGSGLNPKLLYKKFDITEGSRGSNMNEYNLFLTDEALEGLNEFKNVKSITQNIDTTYNSPQYYFPNNNDHLWNIDNYGPILIPKKGSSIDLTMENLDLYKDIIEIYEENTLKISENNIYINDSLTSSYKFKMNYYWMMGDNRHNSADSRMWGFLPENHVVGKALFVWMSWDKNGKGLNKIRWDRLFSSVK